MKKLGKLFLLLCAATPFLAACHTMEGLGKDIESLGKSVEEAAD